MDTIEINIKSNIPEVTKETTGLRQQVKELRKEMESCEVGSDEYNAALVKLAQTTHDFREQQEMVKNSSGDLGTIFSNMQGVATGVAAGFSSVNAVMSLMGSNSEDLQKTMVKLQAGIALVQGMKGLEGMGKKITGLITSVKAFTTANKALAASEQVTATSTNVVSKAFKGLKAALLASGIGGIIVLVGALVAGMAALVGVIRNNLQAENEFKDTNEQLNKSFEKQNEALDLQIKYLEADGATTGDIIAEKQKLVNAQKEETKAALENARARLAQLKADSGWRRFWHGENKVIKELEKETIPELEKTLEGLEKKSENLSADLYVYNKKTHQKIVADNKKAEEEAEKTLQKYEDKAKSTFDNVVTAYKKMHTDLQNVGSLSDALKGKLGAADKAFAVYAADDLFTSLEKELTGVTDKKIREAIVQKYITALGEVGKDISNIKVSDVDTPDGLNKILLGDNDELILSARQTVTTFEEQFNSLQTLYENGLISYDEFYSSLVDIQTNYEKEISGTNENMVLFPEKLRKEVGDKFVSELKRQLDQIDRDSSDFWYNYNKKALDNLENNTSAWKTFWGESAKASRDSQKQILDDENTQYQKEYESRKAAIENMLQNNALTVEQKQELNDKLAELDSEKLEHDIQYYEDKKQIDADYYASLLNTASTTFSAAANLISSINENVNNKITKLKDKASKALEEGNKEAAKKYEAQAKKEFETSKALQIAQAIISGAAGVAQAIAGAMSLGPIAGPIVGGINAAAVVASTVAQVSAIKNTKFESSSTADSQSASVPDTSFTLTSPDAYSSVLTTDTETELQKDTQQNQKVYVVAGEISDAQEQNKTVVTTSTF